MNGSLLDHLRNPEYTGENRCIPCTTVNVVLAVIFSTIIGYVAWWLGLILFACAITAIYFRGYLVPGTPTLTKRYFPARVLRWFDKDVEGDSIDDLDVEAVLQAADVVTLDEDIDDLVLTPEFESDWYDRIESVSISDGETQKSELAALLDVDADQIELERRGDAVMSWIDGQYAGQWESKPAFIADVAADRVLVDRYGKWERFPLSYRSEILGSLRIFLERCPGCDGPVTLDQEVKESCCRSYDVIAASCTACGSRLFETEVDSAALDESVV